MLSAQLFSQSSKIRLATLLSFLLILVPLSNSSFAGLKPSSSPSPMNLLKSPKGSAAPGYGFTFNTSAKEKIDIWEDFQCLNCGKFERANSLYINQLVAGGKVKVIFHTLAFIGAESQRLANAAGCAADEGKFLKIRDLFFKEQSLAENSGIWTSDYLLLQAASIGLKSQKFRDCVTKASYANWIRAVNATATPSHVSATPTVFVDGRELNRTTDYYDLGAFTKAVENPTLILSSSPLPTPTPFKLNFSVSKVFGVEPTIGTPAGDPPTTLGLGDIVTGTGATLQESDTATVQYILMDWKSGQILETSWKTGPVTFPIQKLIKGWQLGLPGMRVGGRRLMVVPPSLAYGPQGSGKVGPNATLVFVIDLLAITH